MERYRISRCTVTSPTLSRNMHDQTFSPPSSLLDDSATLLDIWDYHQRYSSDHPLFKYNSGEASNVENVITWGTATQAMHAAGKAIVDTMIRDNVFDPKSGRGDRPVVGVLALSGLSTLSVISSCSLYLLRRNYRHDHSMGKYYRYH